MKIHLIVDVSNLAYRAMYTTGGLSHNGEATGVLYGIFKTILELEELFTSTHTVFCFDGGYDKRQEILPGYKQKRRSGELSEEDLEMRRDLRRQLYRLRTMYLSEIGYKNVFWQSGYEADDIIASIVHGMEKEDEGVIVSSDHDLFQLLSPKVMMWNPVKKTPLNDKTFTEEWGLSPTSWADVKSLAGCSTDNIPGIPGVGEKTAAKFLTGKLKGGTKKHDAIVANNNLWERNLKLVRLPMEGTEKFTCVDNVVAWGKWRKVLQKLGMKSLLRR
jgi:DNA polymerase-1